MNKHKIGIFFLTFIVFSGVIFQANEFLNASSEIATGFDDNPYGEEIVDMAAGAIGSSKYALTKDGNVYSWGENVYNQLGRSDVATNSIGKVEAPEGSTDTYLSNVVAIYAGGTSFPHESSGNGVIGAGGFALAITSDGKLYGWGANKIGTLGLPEYKIYPKPTEITLPFSIRDLKNIYAGSSNTYFLLTNGEVYVTGHGGPYYTLGIGNVQKTNIITKIDTDDDGNPLPKITQIGLTLNNTYFLTESKEIYAIGASNGLANGTSISKNKAVKSKKEDGTFISGVKNIFGVSWYTGNIAEMEDGTFYYSFGIKSNINYYVPLNNTKVTFSDVDNVLSTNKSINTEAFGFAMFSADNKIYQIGARFGNQLFDMNFGEIIPYEEGDITKSYQGAKKVIGGTVWDNKFINFLVLSEKGALFDKGKRLKFGNIIIASEKEDGTTHLSEEKHNGNLTLNISTDIVGSTLNYHVTDLQTGEVLENQSITDGKVDIEIEDEVRLNKKYEVYQSGKEHYGKETFIVDLYKKEPAANGVIDGGRYKTGKTITFDWNGFETNTISAKIRKDGGDDSDYTSGTSITEVGNYTVTITDLYGNTKSYNFEITSGAVIESVKLTTSTSGELVYGNTITQTGNVIGTISLKYMNGDTPSDIQTAIVGTSEDGSNFEIINKDELKVINKDLISGKKYRIPVTGTDENGIPFSDIIEIEIGKAKQTMNWNDASSALKTNGLEEGVDATLGVTDVLGSVHVAYGLKTANSCVSVNSSTGVVRVTCMPTPATVTFTATPSGNENYTEDVIELSVTIKKATAPTTKVNVNVTSEGKSYTVGKWAKEDITFTLSGGSTEAGTTYEFTTTNGETPNASSTWVITNATKEHKVVENVNDKTYWFRLSGDATTISTGIKVKLDVDKPTVPTFTIESVNTGTIAKFINFLSFGGWMKEGQKITINSTDNTSGIESYTYIEKKHSGNTTKSSTTGIIVYNDDVNLSITATSIDKAGNISETSLDSGNIMIDKKAPTIQGAKDQSEYKQYYIPRTVTITDEVSGLKEATYKLNGGSESTIENGKHKFTNTSGDHEVYEIDAEDHAGNNVSITFKIIPMPDLDDIDGSDESKDIIDQIQKELDEEKENLDEDEKKDYEDWLTHAKEKWESLRKKKLEHTETGGVVEGMNGNTFDPKTELIVEPIEESEVPLLPRKALHIYDVYLRKGAVIVQPNGQMKVYLPYDEEPDPIVYVIDENDSVSELNVTVEGGYVTFVTSTLDKYAISNVNQAKNENPDGNVEVPPGGNTNVPNDNEKPDDGHNKPEENTKPSVCVPGPDGVLGTGDDICGNGNGTDEPVKNPDGSVNIPSGGNVVFPGGVVLPTPDGAIINPDGSVTLPNGDVYNADGSKREPQNKKMGSANTGDNTNILMLIIIMILTGVGIGYLTIKRNRFE